MAQKITPCLWFDMNCEEAVNHYVDTFNGAPHKKAESKILTIQRYEEGMETPGNEKMIGKILTVIFELEGQRFMALDGGPVFKPNEAVSFVIDCQDQEELDYFTGKLSAVKESEQCGWVKDQFGLSWQITPKQLDEMLVNENKKKAHAAMNAMLKMKRLVIADLQKAFDEA